MSGQRLPFTVADFLDVLRAYNLAIWPGQVVLYALGAALALVAQFTSRDNLYPRGRAQGTEDSIWHRQ